LDEPLKLSLSLFSSAEAASPLELDGLMFSSIPMTAIFIWLFPLIFS
jgi:hypothetical protein